ncbi:hypothetical protein BH09ACT7_BH09ACT7_35340 [soil metagenome]
MADMIAANPWTASLAALLVRAPSWTRLEPQSLTGDPGPGLAAAVYDPLWMLTRQRQFGEFAGEDAGTPLAVRVDAGIAPMTRWQPGDWTATEPQSARQLPDEPLSVCVEREPTIGQPGLRVRAEAGAALLAALREAGLDDSADDVLRQAALTDADRSLVLRPDEPTQPAPRGPGWTALALLLRGRAVDADKAAQAFEDAGPGQLPAWLDGPGRDQILAVTDRWCRWYRADIAPSTESSSWVGRRLEHRFSVGIGTQNGEIALRAPEAGTGNADWWSFDVDPAGLGPGAVDQPPEPLTHRSVATPLRFPGMPADRFWEFEDAQIDIGALESDPHDLARLLVAECALIYGCDWLVLPIDLPTRSLAAVHTVFYRNTFGETYRVARTSPDNHAEPWRMFTVTAPAKAWEDRIADPGAAAQLDGLVVPPALVSRIEGPAIEEVIFLRDESANLVWGVERIVEDAAGDPLLRTTGHHEAHQPFDDRVAGAELDYLLQTSVPQWWIPYVARISGGTGIGVGEPVQLELLRAALLRFGAGLPAAGEEVHGIGRLLNEVGQSVIADAEVPREGVRVQRVPVLARRSDGSYDMWTARRVSVGRGEGRSGLAYDSALPRHAAQ